MQTANKYQHCLSLTAVLMYYQSDITLLEESNESNVEKNTRNIVKT